MDKHEVVIIGSGIAGLSSAFYLDKQGVHDYLLLERYSEPGGLCRSIQKNGFTFDMTGHVLWRMDPETRMFYDEILQDNLTWVDRKASVYTHGGYVPYPFQSHLKYLPEQVAYECLLGFLQRDRWLKGTDFESWSLSMFGEGIHRHFMVPFNEKLFGVPMKEMTSDWVQDIPVPVLDQILRGTILGEVSVQKGNAKFGYPKVGGMQSLVDATIARIDSSKIMTGRKVVSIDFEAKTVTHADWSGNLNTVQYEKLISTMPFNTFLTCVKYQDDSLKQYASLLRANAVACVMIGFEKPLTDYHWIYTPEKKYPFYRMGFPNNLVDSVAPPGCGSVTAEITIPKDMSMDTNDIIKSTLFGLKDMGLWKGEHENPVLVEHVEWVSPAYAIYDEARKQVPKLISMLNELNVQCVGRYGSWEYQSISDGVAQARVGVKELLKCV